MNVAAIPLSMHRAAPVSRKPLAIVCVVMAILAFGIAAALEFGGLRTPAIADAGAVPFILPLLAGALAGWVASFGPGILGGALTGLAYALGGGIVRVFFPGPAMPLPEILAAIILMTMFGALLGALGALPFALMKWRREKNRVRRY